MDKLPQFRLKKMTKTRTAGDGMESEEAIVKEIKKETPFFSEIIQVYPSNNIVTLTKKKSTINSKSPKFVPYEPYAAAVKPITPHVTSRRSKTSRNNMDINTLISQMSQMNTNLNVFKPQKKQSSVGLKLSIESIKENPERAELQKKINDLQKSNDSLTDQLKQQVQVNKELKTMLVASMGEDLEIQVQSLNEDKKHLANALVSSTQHLSTHQEQTEWLAGQCEVWRSKFLASSLMVEELASCKRLLSDKTEKLQQAIKQLLEERCRARDMMLCTYRNLYSCHEKFLENIAISEYMDPNKLYHRPIGNLNFNVTLPHSTNILDLASVNLKLSENISSSVEKQDLNHLENLLTTTEGERHAENVMAMPLEVKKISEVPLNALVHHAYSNTVTSSKPVASCIHCSGRVQLL